VLTVQTQTQTQTLKRNPNANANANPNPNEAHPQTHFFVAARFILTQTAIDLDWELIEQVASGCITQVSPNTVPSHRQSHSRTFTTGNASFKRTLNLVCLLHALTHTHTPTHHRTRTPLDCLG
jgi:2-oxoglutarate dehydrogenase complex dehydrogenase (E1) component-like enzyme